MKFYNNVCTIESSSSNCLIVDNSVITEDQKSAVIITIQIINNVSESATISFKRSQINEDEEVFMDYNSNVIVKSGTTILDHTIVVPNGQRYYVSSDTIGIVISCSYGI